MQITALFTTAFVVGLSGAMMPGPLLTAAIVSTSYRGFRAGPQIVLGHGILELALVFALLAGAASFLLQPAVTTVIALAGGVFLLYLGYVMIHDVRSGKLETIDSQISENTTSAVNMHPIAAGFLISVSNPFWSIWWITIGLSYLTMSLKSGAIGVAAFFSGHILADLLWYSFVALAISRGKGLFSPRVYQAILISCGIFMLGLGVYFFYSGITGITL